VPFVIQPLARGHDRDAFDCGEPALNEFLQRFARQHQERGLGRTWVAVPEDGVRVVGYYTLAAGAVEFDDVPDDLRRRLPRYPVPVAHPGRLAVCRSARGQGLGAALLLDALLRVLAAADRIGIAAVDVRAKTAAARDFYRRYGFQPLLDDAHHLFLPLDTVRRLVAEEGAARDPAAAPEERLP
jgi:GNAT superfamily N-acetyltransferase